MAAAKKRATAAGATSKRAPAARTSKSTAKKTAPKKAAAEQAATKKRAVPKRAAAKKSAPKTAASKRATPEKTAPKKSTAKKTAAKKPAADKAVPKKAATKKAAKKSAPKRAAPKQTKASRTATAHVEEHNTVEIPKPRFNKDGFGYTKDYDLAFVKEMHDALQNERVRLTGQAKRLEDEAHQLVEEAEMGDVQFDDEGGEGDTMIVERERDLALSAQAREAVVEIDAALDRILRGTYGYSLMSGRPIPRERLEAIPWSTVLVEEKVGGIGRR
jgi:RNA polymerase-binding transcription factor DksA